MPFVLPNPKNQNFLKNEKNAWRYYHFTLVYHTCVHLWFLRYGAQQAEFFVILDYFLPFCPLKNLQNQNFEKMKKIIGDIFI